MHKALWSALCQTDIVSISGMLLTDGARFLTLETTNSALCAAENRNRFCNVKVGISNWQLEKDIGLTRLVTHHLRCREYVLKFTLHSMFLSYKVVLG